MTKFKKNQQRNLADYFDQSLELARKIKLDEHRANPFLNILNCTLKTEMQFPDLFNKKYLLWRFFNSCKGLFCQFDKINSVLAKINKRNKAKK